MKKMCSRFLQDHSNNRGFGVEKAIVAEKGAALLNPFRLAIQATRC
jgi:hypothetical protein